MKRYTTFGIGVLILALGIILNTKSTLGVGAINTVPYSLAQITGLTLGTMTSITYILFITIELILLKRFDLRTVAQMPFSVVFGWIIDLVDHFIILHPSTLPERLCILACAVLLTAFGAFLLIRTKVVLNPPDGLCNVLSEVLHQPFGNIKNCLDLTCVGTTCILCLVLKRPIYGVGLGTIISAIMIGRCIAMYTKLLGNKDMFTF